MDERPTLEEQLRMAKAGDKIMYANDILRAMDGERTQELYDRLCNPPMFLKRDATRLLSEIIRDFDDGRPISAGYVRKPANISAFVYLFCLDLVDVQECPYLGLFKRKVIVPKKNLLNILYKNIIKKF